MIYEQQVIQKRNYNAEKRLKASLGSVYPLINNAFSVIRPDTFSEGISIWAATSTLIYQFSVLFVCQMKSNT